MPSQIAAPATVAVAAARTAFAALDDVSFDIGEMSPREVRASAEALIAEPVTGLDDEQVFLFAVELSRFATAVEASYEAATAVPTAPVASLEAAAKQFTRYVSGLYPEAGTDFGRYASFY